jgi:predicted nucleic acid-binding protein
MADWRRVADDVPGRIWRVCIDLNVLCAAILADARGRNGTAAQTVLNAVRRGDSPLGEMQLVISWPMLNTLRRVLHSRFPLVPEAVEAAVSAITQLSRLGPHADGPHLLLGVGVLPLQDAEDAHIMEVALAGRADLLITNNFKHFVSYRTDVREAERIAVHAAADAQVLIAQLFTAAKWFREGRIVIP